MDEMELMMHLHRNNKRQGPGSEDATNPVSYTHLTLPTIA